MTLPRCDYRLPPVSFWCTFANVATQQALDKLPPKANLRPAEVAAFLDINSQTVYELIAEGIIPAIRMRRQYRIPREQFMIAYRRLYVEPLI